MTVGESTQICIGCGLCCDGTVVSHLALVDETDLGWPLRMLGVEPIVAAEPPVFALPCPALCDGACSVFHQHRPSACGEFACDLLQAVDAGHVGSDAARATIEATIRLRDAVVAGTADPAALRAQVRAHFRAGTST